MRHPTHLLAGLGLVLALATAPAAAPISGRVVEADTAIPVAGANVSAGPAATVTGDDGRFHLDAWADTVHVTHIGYHAAAVAAGAGLLVRMRPLALPLAPVVVRAGLTAERLQRATASVSVLGSGVLRAPGVMHLQHVIAQVPNLNWAGGTSRPRYLQIRGIGERSRFAGEGPPSFSVGTVVDDVDLSGLGTGGLLFDIDQVEVYRGPQSTVFGANAMAGLLHVRSAEPAAAQDAGATVGLGTDGRLSGQGFVNTPLAPDWRVRLGVAHGRVDGFRDNAFLGRHDTNRRRESVARAKVRWQPDPLSTVTATAFWVNADNGYDAWAPDNNEDLVTYTDKPGVDRQRTAAVSLRAELPVAGIRDLRLVSISAWSRTQGLYSFDGDWGNEGFWRRAPYGFDPAAEGYAYDFFDRTHRQRTTATQELRLVHRDLPGPGGSGVIGVYGRRLREDTRATGYLFGGDAGDLRAAFDVDEAAVYARYARPLTARLRGTVTLRADRNDTGYDGVTDGARRVRFDAGQWLWGGRAGLSWVATRSLAGFASVARGYRAGGVNQHPFLADRNRPYTAEYVLNTEAGLRWQGEAGRGSVTLFRTTRSRQQVELSTQQDPGDPNSFVYFTSNAAGGWNAGLEAEAQLSLRPDLLLNGSLGLLASHVEAYTFLTGQGERLQLGDRAAAHAPSYNLSLGASYAGAAGPTAALALTAMDAFYFSESHDRRSSAYALLHGSLGWRGEGWSLQLWGRNLLDRRYAVRGFFFGLEPPAYQDRLYVQYGDPRQVGLTLRFHPFAGGR